jgi:UDP-N-acetyl-D-mannosaminuronic acid dehydrogenase
MPCLPYVGWLHTICGCEKLRFHKILSNLAGFADRQRVSHYMDSPPQQHVFPFDVCVVGGAGHVGLPLSIAFAAAGLKALVYDINPKALETIANGNMPFMEHGAEPILRKVLAAGRLAFSTDPSVAGTAKNVIVVIGTPVDEFLNPSLKPITRCMDSILPFLSDEQLVVLRSTVYPGATETIGSYMAAKGKNPKLAFCPERIVQGQAIEELKSLPQIVSGTTAAAEDAAADLFARVSPEILRYRTIEAELIKLFSNAYRYIQFAVTNQFFLVANAAGADYYRVLEGMRYKYPRMAEVPGPGFAAGPCLFKDTMQLAAFYKNQFSIGHAAMLVNESLPMHVIDMISRERNLGATTVGLLGMAFKANNDDRRSSLSYKLKKLLGYQAKAVLTTDPYVSDDPELLPIEEVISRSDVLVLCAPHRVYAGLNLSGKCVIDIWNFWNASPAMAIGA